MILQRSIQEQRPSGQIPMTKSAVQEHNCDMQCPTGINGGHDMLEFGHHQAVASGTSCFMLYMLQFNIGLPM